MGLTITQFGGGWESNAGDSCVITFTKNDETKHIIIDLGIPNQFRCAMKSIEQTTDGLCGIILTHFHVDHAGKNDEFLKILELLPNSIQNQVVLPPQTTMPVIADQRIRFIQTRKPQVTVIYPGNGDIIFENIEIIDGHEMVVKIQAIVPRRLITLAGLDENICSMGCLITVAYGAKVWRMLTLGDMVADTAEQSIQDVLTDNNGGYLPVNVIKVPHHFSAKNHMDIISHLYAQGYQARNGLTQRPTIVSSGYAGGEFNPRVVRYLLKFFPNDSSDSSDSSMEKGKLCILFNQQEITESSTIKSLVGPVEPPSVPVFCRLQKELINIFDIKARNALRWTFQSSRDPAMHETEFGQNVLNCKRGRTSSPEVPTHGLNTRASAKAKKLAKHQSDPT